jgi:hypothetical protein
VQRFEQVLARSNDLPLARRQSGLSGREFEQYRRSFGSRESASPFLKENGRWVFRGARGFQHTFLNGEGRETSATFSGRNLIAMQNYRSAISERDQGELDAWKKAHSSGVTDDSGQLHHPETQLARIDSSLRRMGKRQRRRFHQQQFYPSERPCVRERAISQTRPLAEYLTLLKAYARRAITIARVLRLALA